MIFNFPTEEDIAEVEPETVTNDHPSYLPTFVMALEMLWPDMRITVCHTGQEYYFADAKLEFLHTVEDFYPLSIATLSSNNLNGASAIFTVEIAGQKIMFLGDSAMDESSALVSMWGDYLKCDIMQASHHCQRGGTVELYEAIDPTVVLAPLPWQSITKRNILNYESTRWLWNNGSGNIREIILSGFQQRVLELPYSPATDVEYFSGAIEDPWGGQADQYQTNPN
jgi:beta-lactamase superfamily II metal-dependent hydrolase